MAEKFSAEANARWGEIPQSAKDRILKNVWCCQCKNATTISDFRGQMKGDDLLLQGQCIKCGHAVARLIEGG
jgi:hypothetical protein